MKVKIQYLGLVKTYTNKNQDDITLPDDAPLSQLLDRLALEFGTAFAEIYDPAKKEVKPMFTIMLNGIIIEQLKGVETKLKDSDNIIIMPLMTGG